MYTATSSIDKHTDQLIQDLIRNRPEFVNKTVLCIAHRLETIIDYDRIMVLSKGQVVEFDTPHALINKPNGVFASMVDDVILNAFHDSDTRKDNNTNDDTSTNGAINENDTSIKDSNKNKNNTVDTDIVKRAAQRESSTKNESETL